MIAPMKKVYLVLLESEKADTLNELGRLGLIHLAPVPGKGKVYEETARRIAEAERAIGALGSYKAPKSVPRIDNSTKTRVSILETNEHIDSLKILEEQNAALAKEIERVQSWGDFDPIALKILTSVGAEIKIFEGPVTKLSILPESLEYVRLSSPKGIARIAIRGDTLSSTLPSDFMEFALPGQSLESMREQIQKVKEKIAIHESALALLSASIPAMKKNLKSIKAEHVFEAFRSGMDTEGPICHLKGYIPVDDFDALAKAAKSHGIGFLADDPAPDEMPPTKMKNTPFIRIIEPIFDFLGTTPGYREYDISAWFLIFFCFFFAMIFGDAGYGILMLATGIFAARKARRNRKAVPDIVRLLLLLAISTIAYGAVTGTWFGLPTDRLPAILRFFLIPAIAGDNPASPENIKIICFVLGAIQISIAHIKNIIRDFPNPKFLAQVGWLLSVIGLYFVVLNLVLSASKYPIPQVSLTLIGIGFILVFVFGNWDGHLGKSLLAGLGGLLTQFLGTVSALADIISYIRLFAVGLAGVAIAQTVNSMGGGALGSLIGAIGGVAILAFGHALNLAMSMLSVIVHGVRLNVLEFSGHLGMEWSGYKYEPFRGVEEDSAN